MRMRLHLASTFVLAALAGAASLDAQARGAAADASLSAYQDANGVATVSLYPAAGFALILDAATGLNGAVRLDAGGAGSLFLLGRGSAMTPSAHRISLTQAAGDTVLGIDAMGTSRRLARLPLRDERIEFARDSFTLRGNFVRPVADGRHPVVLLLNGSGPSPRGLLANVAALLAANGVAGLVYDKRGTGASTGRYTGDDFLALSEDARAALRYLRSRPDVDTTRIGILGTSQGVYVAMMVAASDPGIRFIVSSNGGAFPAEQEIYRRVREVADSGHGPEAQEQARAFLTRLFSYYASVGSGSPRVDSVGLAALYRAAAGQPWWPAISGPSSDPTVGEWPPARTSFAADLGRDWAGIYRRVRAKVYAVNASGDPVVPPHVARETLVRHLPGGASQVQSRLLDGDHGFTVTGPDGSTPIHDPRYLPLLVEWVVAATRR